jgi:hypothetical protein
MHSHPSELDSPAVLGPKDWADMTSRDHFVQFYDREDDIIKAVAGYLSHGLRYNEFCVLVASEDHISLITEQMSKNDPIVAGQLKSGSFIAHDARQTLAKFMVGNVPSKDLFESTITEVLSPALASGKRIRIFGEMVALLVADGNPAAAVALENLWNELAQKLPFRLFCAYPENCLASNDTCLPEIHATHSHVLDPVSPIGTMLN